MKRTKMLLLTILGYIADVNIQVVKTTTTTNKIKKVKKKIQQKSVIKWKKKQEGLTVLNTTLPMKNHTSTYNTTSA